MPAFVDHQISQINKEKGAVLAEGVDQESGVEDEPGRQAVARGGPPVLCVPVLGKDTLQVFAHPRNCSGIALRKTGYGGAPASEHCNALLITLDTDPRDVYSRQAIGFKHVDESSSMDRDAGAAGPGVGSCGGPDLDSSIGAVELCRLTDTPASDRR